MKQTFKNKIIILTHCNDIHYDFISLKYKIKIYYDYAYLEHLNYVIRKILE